MNGFEVRGMKQSKITDEQKKNLNQFGYELVEDVEVGGYDLALTHFPLLGAYHLALQRQGQDFSSPEQQMTKIPGGISADMTLAIPTIDKWIKKYKELWIGGDNPSKIPVYEKILKRLGYTPDKMDFMGLTLMSIDKPSTRTMALKSSLLVKAEASPEEIFEELGTGDMKQYNKSIAIRPDSTRNPIYQ